jgi:hypothetical protein
MKTTFVVGSVIFFAAAITSVVVVQTSTAATAAQDSTAIRPFTVPTVPQAALDDLRRRIAATRWPEKETVADQSQGVQLATMRCRTSSRRSMGWTFISFTSGRRKRTRCR